MPLPIIPGGIPGGGIRPASFSDVRASYHQLREPYPLNYSETHYTMYNVMLLDYKYISTTKDCCMCALGDCNGI